MTLINKTKKDFNRNNKKSDTIKKCLSFIRYED